MESDVVEEEPSVLDYARSHGLSIDYTTDQPRINGIWVSLGDHIDQDLWGPSDASITTTVSELTKERLAVNQDAALLLKAVHTCSEAPTTDLLITDRRKWILGLRQELPVLKTDYELDLLQFGSVAMPHFKTLKIPLEVIDEENDEEFEWSSKYFGYPALCDEQAKADKIAISRGSLVHLQDAIRDTYTSEDSEKIKAESLKYKPNTAVQPLTPPLLPLSPPLTPYVPSSPADRLPLASDNSDSVTAEAKVLERQIMAADSLECKNSDSSEPMLFDITHPLEFRPLLENRMSPLLKRRVEDLKVEGPLTPPMFSTSPMKKLKSVSFANILHEYIPHVPWVDDSGDDNDESSIDFDEFFKDIEPLANQAKRKVEHEQLSGADTTARVNVPDVDFVIPIAPWSEYSQASGGKHKLWPTELDAQLKFLHKIKREDLKTATSWHGLTALERDLRWSIFTNKVSTINLEEKIHGENEFIKMLTEITTGNIATSSLQVWKREGLRILEDEDHEEELKPAEKEERRDMETLIRKRKLELEEEAAEVYRKRTMPHQISQTHAQPPRQVLTSHHQKESSPVHRMPPKVRLRTFNNNQQSPQAPLARHKTLLGPVEPGNELMFGGFSATTALHKFMETRGKPVEPLGAGEPEKHRVIVPSVPKSATLAIRSREPSIDHSAPANQHASAQLQTSSCKGNLALPLQPNLPDIPKNLAPCSFILSSLFLQQRSLMKQIEQLYPCAEIVFRDYNLPHSAAHEADILLSPSSGLILTTLQQVKQRALPGQPDRSPVKERMISLQLRYERLVVMVSEGLSREMETLGSSRPSDPRDQEALSRFEAFAVQLEGEVLIRFVRGGEHALARSTVVEMANYGLPHGSADIGDIKPLAVETSWEVFLRRAGINPFAAQVIVAFLMPPFNMQRPVTFSSPTSSEHSRTVSVSGLPAFVMMDAEERVKYFQTLMGGSRILRRVSRVLDQEWVSAAHGFRM